MPQVFKIGSYWVYFWSNENDPLEPIHVHVSEGTPNANGIIVRCKPLLRTDPAEICGRMSDILGKEAIKIIHTGKTKGAVHLFGTESTQAVNFITGEAVSDIVPNVQFGGGYSFVFHSHICTSPVFVDTYGTRNAADNI